MKKSLVLGLSFALLSLSLAHAGNESPHGAPQAPAAPVIAEVAFYPGFFAGPAGHVPTIVSLHADGLAYRTHGTETVWFATLSTETVGRLSGQISALAAQPLRDDQEGRPMCSDAPVTVFRVFKTGAPEPLEIAKAMGCHHFQLESDGSYAVERTLQALLDLSH